ncbi:MAG: cellulase family glycosylhydrolase [Myxococcaceae bacterium]
MKIQGHSKAHSAQQPKAQKPQAPQTPLPNFGFNEAWGRWDVSTDQLAQMAQQTGAQVGRLNVCWDQIETSPGVYDQAALGRLDDTIAAMEAHGIKPVLVAISAPAWSHPSNPDPTARIPQDPQFDGAFGNFTAMVANRYKDAAAIEIWNEPNLPDYGNIPPQRYAQMLTAATAAIHAQSPDTKVLSAGLSPVNQTKDHPSWEQYLKVVMQNAKGDFDVAIHPYARGGDAKTLAAKTERQYAEARQIAQRDIWITEMGFSSGDMSQTKQAKALRDTFEQLEGKKHLESVIVHRLMDDPTYQPGSSFEQGLGMVDASGAPKKAFRMLRRIYG